LIYLDRNVVLALVTGAGYVFADSQFSNPASRSAPMPAAFCFARSLSFSLGRSRGGLSTKIHLAVRGLEYPVRRVARPVHARGPSLRWLLDLPQARAIAGGANNLGQILARSFHRNQSSKRNKKTLVHLTRWSRLVAAAQRKIHPAAQTAASTSTEKPISVSRSLTGPRHTITPPCEHGLRLSSGGKSSHADGRRSDQ
jgi:hypothetical protein